MPPAGALVSVVYLVFRLTKRPERATNLPYPGSVLLSWLQQQRKFPSPYDVSLNRLMGYN